MGLFSSLSVLVCYRYTANFNMQNDAGEVVDLYLPRKCSATNSIIAAQDHASVQINIAKVNPQTGVATGEYYTYAFCGPVRSMGEVDDSLNRLADQDGILDKVY